MLLKRWQPLKTDQWQYWEQKTFFEENINANPDQDFGKLETANHPNATQGAAVARRCTKL